MCIFRFTGTKIKLSSDVLSQHFSQIERFKIIGTKIGTDKSLGADKLVYNHMLVLLSVHK